MQVKNFLKTSALVLSAAVLLTGCKSGEEKAREKKVQKASVKLAPTKDNKVSGTVAFTVVEGGVLIVADVDGLTPGKHGIHVHEKGDCSAPDGSSAGAHFNPTNKKHGGPDNKERHVGDLGNLEADSNGHAHYELVDNVIELEGDNTIVGRSVVIHAGADDFTSQPAGNSGGRLACGVIEAETASK